MKINEIASLKALVSNRAPEIIPDEMIHHFTKASTQHHLNKLAIALMMIWSNGRIDSHHHDYNMRNRRSYPKGRVPCSTRPYNWS